MADKQNYILPDIEETNQIMKAVLNHTHMMAVLLDENFNFIWVNRAYADTCRHEPSFFPGKNHFDLYPHDENQLIFQRVIDTGKSFYVEAKPFEFPDQPERGITYWDWSLTPVKSDVGKVTGLVFTLAEVTERIRAVEEIISLAKFPEENINPVMRVSTDGTVIYANKASVKCLTYHGSAVGKPLFKKLLQPTLKAFSSGKAKESEFTCCENRILSFTIVPVKEEGYANLYGSDITERKKAEEEITASLKEKEVLLQEVHHRVKNNMQVIISLLRLQGRKTDDKRYTQMLQESQGRIRTMALVHEKLYQSKSLAKINSHEYIKSLANEVYRSYGVNISKIRLKVAIEDVTLNIEDAIPCGLIINELLSNSMKYAFPHDREGEISISLCSKNKDKMELTVSDNGVGLPEGLDYRDTKTMGLELVRTLVEHQLEGKIELDRSEGARYHIVFKKQHYKARV